MTDVKIEEQPPTPPATKAEGIKPSGRSRTKEAGGNAKRKCVSTACIACRRRKSKCDGNMPSCAACASVYGTECVYDPNSDHRRKGVYKKGVDSSKTPDSTLKIIVEGILNYPEHEVMQLVKQIRSCENLDDIAQSIAERNSQKGREEDDIPVDIADDTITDEAPPRFERELLGKVGELKLESGAIQYLGGTSNLLYVENDTDGDLSENEDSIYASQEEAIRSWTTVTADTGLILHLLYMYFTWHYTYFTTLSRSLFFRDFLKGKPMHPPRSRQVYCTPLLVNAMLTLGCHFTSWPAARADPDDSATAGDHFHRECKRILVDEGDYEVARMATVQALALMSVREAGCGREAKGWFYSGMSFRMASDMGLPYESSVANLPEEEVDSRRVTFWGCYLFDKCWSNYLGRPPQLTTENVTLGKYDVFPLEDADMWSPWTDNGLGQTNVQPARTRAVALQIIALCEISSDLLHSFYRPNQLEKPLGKQAELKKLSDLHTKLEAWRKDLPKEFEAKEGQLPQVLVMHMFFYLLFIHLFRPFLKYNQTNTPLPANVSPRKHCTQSAAAISKLLRLYKKTHGLRQICNIAVYITHSACTIHLLNQQDKDSRRDITYGLRHLEEISESWLCARRTLAIIMHQIDKWQIEIPPEASEVLERADGKYQFSKSKTGGSSNASSPSTEILAAQNLFPQDNPLSPATMARFDFSTATASSIAPMPTAPGPPPISQNARIRSNSSARRTDLFGQVQQAPFQPQQQQLNAQAFNFNPNTDTQQNWNGNMWKNGMGANAAAMTSNNASGLLNVRNGPESQQPMSSQRSPQPLPMGVASQNPVTSPTALFASGQHHKALFEEQKEWWMRDQSTLFDHWMRRDHGSGSGNGTPSSNNGANANLGADLMGMDIYTGLADTTPATTAGGEAINSGGFDALTATGGVTIAPPGWEGFNLQADGSAQQGNAGTYGGFNTQLL